MWSFPGFYANRGSETEQASSDVSDLFAKDAAVLSLREGRYCERNPGGVSFTYNNPAVRTSLRSKLATKQKTADFCRRFSVWWRVADSPACGRAGARL